MSIKNTRENSLKTCSLSKSNLRKFSTKNVVIVAERTLAERTSAKVLKKRRNFYILTEIR